MSIDFFYIIRLISLLPVVGIGAITGLISGLGISAVKNIIFNNGNMSEAEPLEWYTGPLWATCTVVGAVTGGYLLLG